ncbi:class I SAM-dependent methyltransferase [Chloroflexus sp.]|uniref:class I SAM-dependent methyltransferase n=1 Tax=Chloroflexus sp. TaxID=1904827 RepID=UPI002613A3B6|nr:class I SAM-dependent methyltransferase [uncultured Chloroflexus sp.]
MADPQTIRTYDELARQQAAFQRSLHPDAIYRLVDTFFHPGKPTADVGSGSGRDVAWLNQRGFPTVGFEPSTGMIAEARAAYPGIEVRAAALPELAGIADASFDNVLCIAVLMHIPAAALISATINLARIMRPAGRLIISYRTPPPEGERALDGRLYTWLPPARLTLLLESSGLRVLFTEETPDPQRPGIRWFNLVAEKGALDRVSGLERIIVRQTDPSAIH